MDDLPELPFEKVLSYLNLEDRLRLSAVSRSCHQKIVNTRVKSLCFSELPIGLIYGKGRWVSGTLAQNFISSSRFASFFDTYGQTILSNLKHLRLCDLDLRANNETAFVRTLNSFGQLETLDMVRVQCSPQRQFKLTLPMLNSLHLEELSTNRKLILDAPRLRTVRALECSGLRLDIVHSESVETLLADRWDYTEVKKLKSLKYLLTDYVPSYDSTFLSSLEKLKEIHLRDTLDFLKLFAQKHRYGRADLKIYLRGLLLNGPDDPERNVLFNAPYRYLNDEAFKCLAENPSRLADEIPFYRCFYYSVIERIEVVVDLLKRFTDWNQVKVIHRVEDAQRFLDLLKNCESIVELQFDCVQSQDLFERLPEHCAVQKLTLYPSPSDLKFLFRLKHLIHLHIASSIDTETVRKAFEELRSLSFFRFRYSHRIITIETGASKQFRVSAYGKKKTVSDLSAAIEFIVEGEITQKRSKKRKSEHLE